MLNFRQIEVFRAIMIAKSVNGAAKMLHTSQPGLSRMLYSTEQKLGIMLFERKKGRLIPTPEGLLLFEQVQLIYKQIKNLDFSIEQLIQGKDEILRVGASASIGRSLVPLALKAIKQDMPSIKVDFTILTVNQIVDYVTLQMGDVALCLFPPEHPSIEEELLTTGELVAVLPPTHPLVNKDRIDASDLEEQDIITFDNDKVHGQKIAEFFNEVDFEPKISAYVRLAESACALVEAEFGIALVDEFTVMNNSFPTLSIRPLNNPSKFNAYILHHNSIPLSNAAKVFCKKIKKVVSAL
jgi:DNA-binding transcriptional LysR family regulator